ncbi:hypothetical protein ACKGJI_09935 [Sulfurospirillum sp. 1307]|jgi:hypothetical protein
MKKIIKNTVFILFVSLLTFGAFNYAIAQDRPPRGDRIPPKEAIEVCKNLDEGSACHMTTPRGDELEGTCMYTPDDKYFVCMPEDGPMRQK